MNEQKEKCVVCTTETPYMRYTHTDLRKYYVNGAGQLCKKCWIEIYSDKDDLLIRGPEGSRIPYLPGQYKEKRFKS